jgi:hypothetical protein
MLLRGRLAEYLEQLSGRLKKPENLLQNDVINGFFKGPAADPTDASQPSGFLCNTGMKMNSFFFSFFLAMEHRWNGTDRGKPKYSEQNLSQCNFVHH